MTDIIERAYAQSEQILAVQIKNAASRIAPNDITECVDCGNPIGDKRKQALPHALRCIVCQQTFEAKINTKGKR